MDLEIMTLSEKSQIERDKYYRISHIWGIWKRDATKLIYKARNGFTDIENKFMVTI